MQGRERVQKPTAPVLPRRADRPLPVPDSPPGETLELLDLLARGAAQGARGALVTLVAVEGGSARAPGAQMAVLEDGRFAGYVSGGCLESIVASEAVGLMATGRDGRLRFGVGSPFVDVRLPCGGSIDLHVHVDPDPGLLVAARSRLCARQPFAVDYAPELGTATLVDLPLETMRAGWHGERFRRVYLPQTRLLLVGRGLEFETLTRLGVAAGYEVMALAADEESAGRAGRTGAATTRLTAADVVDALPIDPWTALVLLFHDHHWEHPILAAALREKPFYIGALGSSRTHRQRCERLVAEGVDMADIDRIRGPIGLFGPTRDAVSLAFSVLAEIAQLRMRDDYP